jgi:hypothetical protein
MKKGTVLSLLSSVPSKAQAGQISRICGHGLLSRRTTGHFVLAVDVTHTGEVQAIPS